MTKTLSMAAAFCFASMIAHTTALGADVSGSFGSGGNTGSTSASFGGGGMNSTGSTTGPSGTAGSGSLSIGRGSGMQASSSTGSTNNTSSNFTGSLGGGNGAAGSTSLASGGNTFGFGFGQPGVPGPGAPPGTGNVPGVPGATLSGIAAAIGDLSIEDRRWLAKKCVSVLAAPKRHDPNTVVVCRTLASL
jgi:hypothetical protein